MKLLDKLKIGKKLNHSVTIGNKKYSYFLEKIDAKITRLKCPDANIDQTFLNEDLVALLIDLPNLIVAEKSYQKTRDQVIRFRISAEDKKNIEKKAMQCGYSSISGFLRDLAINLEKF